MKDKIFSLIPGRDLIFSTTKGSGPGGQHRNKTETCVILEHPASGVKVRAQSHKSQRRNKVEALERLAQDKKFKLWVKMEAAARSEGYTSLKSKVEDSMREDRLSVEIVTGYRCDSSDCSKVTQVVSEEGEEIPIPWNWTTDGEKHWCPTCSKRRDRELIVGM